MGYNAQWQVYNSKNYGLPQNRERIYIKGYLRGECSGELFHQSKVVKPFKEKSKQIIIGNTSINGKRQHDKVYGVGGISKTLLAGVDELKDFEINKRHTEKNYTNVNGTLCSRRIIQI